MQTAFRRLSRAPIAEALIDFRLRNETAPTLGQLNVVCDAVTPIFPVRKKISQVLFEVMNNEGEASGRKADEGQIGFRMESSDGSIVAQLTALGVTVNKLPPYTEWAELLEALTKVWSAMTSRIGGYEVIRVGVRYINRIKLGPSPLDFDHYLTTGPQIPKGLPQHFTEFLTRTVIPFPDREAEVILTQAANPETMSETEVSVIVDIDAFSTRPFAAGDALLWECCERLRGLKNEVFFSSITDLTLEGIK